MASQSTNLKSPHPLYAKGVGFSLLEVIVAFAILAVGFIAIMSSFPYGISINKGAENTTVASNLARQKVEELISSGYGNVNTGTIEAKHRLSDDQASYLYAFKRETSVNYIDGNLAATSTDAGMKKISTTVYYTNSVSKSEKPYNITTIISQK